MAREKAKWPQSAHARTLPPDPASLEAMFQSVHRLVLDRIRHLIREPHDYHARRGLQTLYEQRAACWGKLFGVAPNAALRLAAEHRLTIPEVA